jgi:hypothetical protein
MSRLQNALQRHFETISNLKYASKNASWAQQRWIPLEFEAVSHMSVGIAEQQSPPVSITMDPQITLYL